jgi:hypothetical protein
MTWERAGAIDEKPRRQGSWFYPRALSLACVGVALASAPVAGCGGNAGSGSGTPGGTTTASTPVASPGDHRGDHGRGHPRSEPTTNRKHRDAEPNDGESSPSQPKPITLPNGTIYTPPPIPSVTEVAPGHKCQKVKQGTPAPPAPGILEAKIANGTLTLAYYFDSPPADCKPTTLRVGIDDSRNVSPAGGDSFRITRERGEVRWAVPDDLRSADIATAIAITADGIQSDAAQVRIR